MGTKERAKERREKRMQEISLLRTIPYSDHQRWWSTETIAVVTGGNRGIGFEISRQFAMHGLTVILTSRDVSVGLEAAKVLQEGGLNVDFHQLDVLDALSIKQFADWLLQNYGGLDILCDPTLTSNMLNANYILKSTKAIVLKIFKNMIIIVATDFGDIIFKCPNYVQIFLQINNAGVNFNLGSSNSVEFAQMVISTNYFGTKNMIQAMIPLMKPSAAGARIVNVSSRLGKLNGRRNRLENVAVRELLSNLDTLSEEVIDRFVSTFLQQVEDGSWETGGWPQSLTDYSVSKLAVNAYTRLMAKIFTDRPEGHKIYVNCYCPGWVKTPMTGFAGNVSAEEGADTGVWLTLLPDQAVTGKFFAERREISF